MRTGLLALPLLLLAGCQQVEGTSEETVLRRMGSIQFRPCTLDGGRTGEGLQAQCGTLSVAEDPAQPEGRHIDLRIAWLPPEEGRKGEPDPVFFLAGGPGQAATDVAWAVQLALKDINQTRDLFFIDQRGTGGSNPLDCRNALGEPLEMDPAVSDAAGIAAYAHTCLASLSGRADPRFYSTSHAIDDLEAVRQALGAPQVNLIGASYGTRVAQQYAARYPDHTRTVVLDGVAPNDLVIGAEFAQTFQRAIEAQSALCRADAACAARFPTDTVAQLRHVIDALRQSPRTVKYRDPATAQWVEEVLPADAVVGLAFNFSYSPEMAALLPVVVDEAAKGRYEGLASLARLAGQSVAGGINRGMQWSVICTEDAGRQSAAPVAGSDTLLGQEAAQLFYAGCDAWPRGQAPAGFTQPLTSDVPALLLSGELDPVTPAAYAERVVAGLPNGRHLVARGRSHGTLSAGCMPDLLAQFVDSADATALDATCLDALRPVPPFTSFNGWEP